MNWSRVKTVFIVLFLCTDLFLLGIYFTSKYTSPVISTELIESTALVLKNNGIAVNSDIIPKKMPSVPSIEVQNVISDYESFAKTALGDEISAIDGGYAGSRGKITFYGDRFNLIPSPSANNALIDAMTVNDEKTAKEVTLTALEHLGFDLKSAKISVLKTDTGYSAELSNYSGSLPIFTSRVNVTLSETAVTSVSGIWFNEVKSSDKNEYSLKNITSTLIDFIPKASENTEITSIKHGYGILDMTSFHKSANLIPVWGITTNDGSTHILDGRTQ